MLNEIKKTRFNILTILIAIVISCSKDITTEDNELNQNLDTDDLEVNLEGELQVSDFVWKGLNEFYYWQEEVSELADEKLNDEKKSKVQFVQDRPGHDLRYALNSNKIRSKLNWSNKVNINDGLLRTLIWYKENKNFYKMVRNKKFKNRLGLRK